MRIYQLCAVLFLVLPAVVPAQFTYTTNNGTITITGYTGSGGAVTIPDTIDGLPVTSIGNNAFTTKTSLMNITFPNSLTNIGSCAFLDCMGLNHIAIPDSVISIGNRAFYNCNSATNVTIGSGVTNIGSSAFFACSSLIAFVVDASNPAYSSADGVLFNKNKTPLIQCPGTKSGSYTIPASVISIGNDAFFLCTSLVSVTMGNSIISIGNYSFNRCTSLTNVTFGNNVVSIGDYAFEWCYDLTKLVIPDHVTTIGLHTFENC